MYIYELQAVFRDNNKRTCELNKDTISPLEVESTDFNDQHGVIFSMFFKVMCYKLIKLHPLTFFLEIQQIPFICENSKELLLSLVQNHVTGVLVYSISKGI